MFGIGWPEFLLIVVVTVIVIGPDELPNVLRQAGKFVHKLRSMSRVLQDAVDDAVREAEIEEITRKANEPYMKELQYELGGPPEKGEDDADEDDADTADEADTPQAGKSGGKNG